MSESETNDDTARALLDADGRALVDSVVQVDCGATRGERPP
jgi:hypothetical protein